MIFIVLGGLVLKIWPILGGLSFRNSLLVGRGDNLQLFIKAGHETREFESCPKNSSLGYQNGLLDTRK